MGARALAIASDFQARRIREEGQEESPNIPLELFMASPLASILLDPSLCVLAS
jgi:hypothetical protein